MYLSTECNSYTCKKIHPAEQNSIFNNFSSAGIGNFSVCVKGTPDLERAKPDTFLPRYWIQSNSLKKKQRQVLQCL